MEPIYEKIDAFTLQETKPITVAEEVKSYDLSFLKQQLVRIQEQKDRDNALRDAEIAEVTNLINQCSILKVEERAATSILGEEIIKLQL